MAQVLYEKSATAKHSFTVELAAVVLLSAHDPDFKEVNCCLGQILYEKSATAMEADFVLDNKLRSAPKHSLHPKHGTLWHGVTNGGQVLIYHRVDLSLNLLLSLITQVGEPRVFPGAGSAVPGRCYGGGQGDLRTGTTDVVIFSIQ